MVDFDIILLIFLKISKVNALELASGISYYWPISYFLKERQK